VKMEVANGSAVIGRQPATTGTVFLEIKRSWIGCRSPNHSFANQKKRNCGRSDDVNVQVTLPLEICPWPILPNSRHHRALDRRNHNKPAHQTCSDPPSSTLHGLLPAPSAGDKQQLLAPSTSGRLSSSRRTSYGSRPLAATRPPLA
jgi:hypothetical protein